MGHDLRAAIAELYGSLPAPRGTLHVVSAARGEDGRLHVLLIGPGAPVSARDFLALQLSRARTRCVLTTAQILRAEPHLSFTFTGVHAAELTRLRAEVVGAELAVMILTRTGDLPFEHPMFEEPMRKYVYTRSERTEQLAARLGPDVEVIGVPEPTPRGALLEAQRRGLHTVSVEAGPSAVAELYAPPSTVDELWLSRAEIPDLPEARLGGALPSDDRLFAGLTCASSVRFEEESGPFRFERWVRSRPDLTLETADGLHRR